MEQNINIVSAQKELNLLYKEKAKANYLFYTIIPGFVAILFFIILFLDKKHDTVTMVIPFLFLLWSLGTAFKIIPTPKSSPRFWTNRERLEYLEGFIAAHKHHS